MTYQMTSIESNPIRKVKTLLKLFFLALTNMHLKITFTITQIKW